ncbi:hypothetical protein [Blattabacterium cuenoti]|uniref:hypothetical protein n=1 Tax=Blattabacterium cuenoti TaxID=1653831 RepID=UPI00163C7214|nr:hypothetical protein [Blattabacterium cuenoti]
MSVIHNDLKLCPTEKKEKDVKLLPIKEKKEIGKIDIRKKNKNFYQKFIFYNF